MKHFLIAFLLLQTGLAKAADLNADQIQDHVVGQSLSWWNSTGWDAGSLVLLPDGKALITVEMPKHKQDSGHWFMKDNQICTTWSELRGQSEKCYTLREVDPGHFITTGGNEFRIISAGASSTCASSVPLKHNRH